MLYFSVLKDITSTCRRCRGGGCGSDLILLKVNHPFPFPGSGGYGEEKWSKN